MPCAAARLWSVRLFDVLVISGTDWWCLRLVGRALSSSLPNLPTGPVIVLGGRGHFCVQPVFPLKRGLVSSQWNAYCRNQRIAEDHALEHFIEHDDAVPDDGLSVLFSVRGWSVRKINRLMRRLQAKHFVQCSSYTWSLTPKGRSRGLTIQRNHRLWTQYLISHADIAANHVDWSVDQVEHVLSEDLWPNWKISFGMGPSHESDSCLDLFPCSHPFWCLWAAPLGQLFGSPSPIFDGRCTVSHGAPRRGRCVSGVWLS